MIDIENKVIDTVFAAVRTSYSTASCYGEYMKFSEDMIEEMKKKISIVGSDYVDMNVNENVLNFCIYSMRSADRADYPIMLETPCTKSFKLKFFAELFNLLPTANYEAQIDSEGMFFLKQIREDEIDLSVALLSED